ncbi:MAG: chemotaxis-specific protein-glutamate methyltransferase CheB [Planctomycetota bacterium]|jgi:two-component system response regulator WspF
MNAESEGRPFRVAIVNDLRLAVEALRRLLAEQEDLELAWIAEHGAEAVDKCLEDRPDLVLMDLVMPEMDGVEATRRIMQDAPCPIVVVTATVDGNLSKVYNALGAGALDAVNGPTLAPDGSLEGAAPVVRKIRMIRRLRGGTLPAVAPAARRPRTMEKAIATEAPLVLVGASTGGPEAVSIFLRALPADFPAPILVVQHLDAQFVPGLVEWLGHQTGRHVEAIEPGTAPAEGKVLVAATDDHLVLGRDLRLHHREDPADTPYRPSVDVFYTTVARSWPRPGVAVVLTGMGRDGAKGLLALREAGWRTFAQDEETSVVYGMPRAAEEAGAAEAVVPLTDMADRVLGAWRRLVEAAEGQGARP